MILQTPTPHLIDFYVAKFKAGKKSGIADRAMTNLLERFPKNNALEAVLLKVVTLNSLYATGILGVYEVAEHIFQLDIDQRLEGGDLSLVEEIAVVQFTNAQRRNYSFATKYCSWHNSAHFPIYDSYVDYVLWTYQKEKPFSSFFHYELHSSYERFVAVLNDFREAFCLTEYSLKHLDHFLWGYGYDLLNV